MSNPMQPQSLLFSVYRKAILLAALVFSFHSFTFSQTRFYLNTGTPAALSPAFNAGWNVTTGASRYEMSIFKDGSTVTTASTGNSGAGAVRKCLGDQWLSEPLAAQTITGTFTGQVQFDQSSTSSTTGQGFLYLRIVNTNGSIASVVGSATTTNLTTTLTNRTMISLNVGTINITAGQRICVDLGWNYSVGTNTTRSCLISQGSSSGTDLPVNNTTTTTPRNPWFQFSQNLAFLPPANDDCAGAISLTPGASCVNTAGTLNYATPNVATPLGCFAAGTYYDVWYKFVATTSAHIVNLSSLGANFTSPQIQIYQGSCAALVSMGCASGTSLLQTGLTPGNTYYVRIANFNADPSGIGTDADFDICITSVSPPANDDCSTATTLTSGTACTSITSNIQYATSVAPAGACGGATTSTTYAVWFKYVATATNETVTLNNLGSNLAAATTYIETFSGTCGSLTSLGCQAASTRQTLSGLTIGTTYYVRVYVTTNPLNTTTANWNFDICVQQPPANDDCAGAVTLTPGATCVNTAGTLDLATPNAATPLGCFAVGTYYDVWYKFVATTVTHTVTLSSLGANFSSPQIQIYSGTCGALVSVGCASGTTLLQQGLTAGTTYYVRIANSNTNPSGLGTVANFNICITNQPTPANNACANATTLTSGTACTNTTANIQYATSLGPSGSCGSATGTTTYDVWFKYVATATTHTVTLSSLGSNLAAATTYIEMLSGACGSLISLGCQAASTRQTISGLTIGNTYYVRVYVTSFPSNASTANWNFNICVQQPPANDDCSGAISLTPGSSCVNTAGTLDLATPNAATPLGCFAAGTYYDVWYKFVAITTIETVTLSSLGANFTSPQIQIYSGTCGSLVSVGCTSGTTLLQWGLTVGSTYYVRIANLNANPSGLGTVANFNICITYIIPPANNDCVIATTITSGTSCSNTAGTLLRASPTGGLPGCGNSGSADVWYTFIAKSNRPVITLSSLGANLSAASPYIQLFSGSCGSLTQLACSVSPLNTAVTPGGIGLSLNSTYFIRITTNTNTSVPTSGTWTFNICITDPTSAVVDYAKSYVNITDGTAGGTINPGDVLEIRSILVVQRPGGSGTNVAIDSVAYYDTLIANKGFTLLKDSMALKTNEGKLYSPTTNSYFTDATDADAAWITTAGAGSDTALQINMGAGATKTKRGAIRHNSKPSNWGNTCIIMATYRVKVNASNGTKIKYGGGAFRYRDSTTNIFYTVSFPSDSLIVYDSPSGCPNSLSPVNVVGDEVNGTFGTTTGSPVFNQNRGTSPNTSYAYGPFGSGNGPNDYYYSVANNTSASGTIVQTVAKPNAARVFNVWDISGDHTGAANTAKGNPPCNLSLPVSATNPCGYMLVVNTAYRTDVAFQTNISGLCPETYYEVSAWIKNICSKCGCDSNGVGATGGGYIPTATGDSSGVRPNIAFQINGLDYYTTGDLTYEGLGSTQTATDTLNKWVKRAFVYKTQPNETSFNVSFRNNAPGGGGNDWAIDDISIKTCNPEITLTPGPNPVVCNNNTVDIGATVVSYYNNYSYSQWEVSANNGSSWSSFGSVVGPTSPVWNGSSWEYTLAYPTFMVYAADSGKQFRVVLASTPGSIGNAGCSYDQGTNNIVLSVDPCTPILRNGIPFLKGKNINNDAFLEWTTKKEEGTLKYELQKSIDGVSYKTINFKDGYNNPAADFNNYSYKDTVQLISATWYRVKMTTLSDKVTYSNIVKLVGTQTGIVIQSLVNPFRTDIKFETISAYDADVQIELLDHTGKIIRNQSSVLKKGANHMFLSNTGNLLPGFYILRLTSGNTVIHRKLIKSN